MDFGHFGVPGVAQKRVKLGSCGLSITRHPQILSPYGSPGVDFRPDLLKNHKNHKKVRKNVI